MKNRVAYVGNKDAIMKTLIGLGYSVDPKMFNDNVSGYVYYPDDWVRCMPIRMFREYFPEVQIIYLTESKSVIYQKEITQCRECPHCKLYPDPDDWFNDDGEKACCGKVLDEKNLPKHIEGMLRPYEKVGIPDWCPLK